MKNIIILRKLANGSSGWNYVETADKGGLDWSVLSGSGTILSSCRDGFYF
jgi:hypothetical protein